MNEKSIKESPPKKQVQFQEKSCELSSIHNSFVDPNEPIKLQDDNKENQNLQGIIKNAK